MKIELIRAIQMAAAMVLGTLAFGGTAHAAMNDLQHSGIVAKAEQAGWIAKDSGSIS